MEMHCNNRLVVSTLHSSSRVVASVDIIGGIVYIYSYCIAPRVGKIESNSGKEEDDYEEIVCRWVFNLCSIHVVP